jgi:4-hydroxy-4-methyl-2-oxoglutarate aldolase
MRRLTLLPLTILTLGLLSGFPHRAWAQEKSYILNPQPYTAEEDSKLLMLFEGLRVADVTDGMDMAGIPDSGLMTQEIKPLWRDMDGFAHRFCGIAVTARYLKTNRRSPKMTPEEFSKWESNWYDTISPEAFTEVLRPGSVLVADAAEDGDAGTIGSTNSLRWKKRGLRGIVTSGGARDTDELIKEKVPVYLKRISRGITPGRNELESVNLPVMCGGILVRPGDVVVADGDGVIVVPRKRAVEVAGHARKILNADKASRRKLYKDLGLTPDKTIE